MSASHKKLEGAFFPKMVTNRNIGRKREIKTIEHNDPEQEYLGK